MATQLKTKPNEARASEVDEEREEQTEVRPQQTVVGWQGVSCVLPPDWNVTGFSMDYDNGYLRIDAPGNATTTVQIRWSNAAKPKAQGPPNLYSLLAPKIRRWRKQPEPEVPKPDLRANLDRLLKDTAKNSKKAKTAFDSATKPEKTEGEQGERTAINFSWTGAGRGQGKIYYCETCHRLVIVQVVGMAKDQAALGAIASQLFGSLQCHNTDGFNRWALYDLEIDIPDDFRIESQKLLSGYLHLVWTRGAERIVVDRWGLANVALKKFTRDEWLRNHALVNLKRLTRTEEETASGHEAAHYAGKLNLFGLIKALRDAKGGLRRFPSRYEGGIWLCPESNKLYAVQMQRSWKSEGLWDEVVKRCACH